MTDQLGWMRDQLARYTRHGWTMTVEPGAGPDGSAVLVVAYTAEDSRNPGRQIGLMARRSIGPYEHLAFDEEWFAADLRRTLLDGVFGHELDETLYRDGKLLNDPHRDPGRWHCTTCGGVGPIKHRGNSWTCPGCHTKVETHPMEDR